MNMLNKQVIHKNYGKGKVVEHNDDYIEINFVTGNKKFIYPDAFGTFLTLTDKTAADSVDKIKQKKENELNAIKAEVQREKDAQQQAIIRAHFIKSLKIHPSAQVAFKCEAEELSNVFTEWRVCVSDLKENEVNKHKLPPRMQANSACLITANHSAKSERERYILGAFLVTDNFDAKQNEDGFINAHPQYRVALSVQESKDMLFWNYYANEKFPGTVTWGKAKYRYFDNTAMAQILRDITLLKKKPQEQQEAQNFYEYFCTVNKLEEKDVPKANGALARA